MLHIQGYITLVYDYASDSQTGKNKKERTKEKIKHLINQASINT
jgi:hypothetical protein